MKNVNKTAVYTNVSKVEGKVVSGNYSENLELKQSYRLSYHSSIFQAELIAKNQVAIWLKNITISIIEIVIHSDSQSALKFLGNVYQYF